MMQRRKLSGTRARPFHRSCKADRTPAIEGVRAALCGLAAIAMLATPVAPAVAQNALPDRIRGEIVSVDDASMIVNTRDNESVRLALSENVGVFTLTKAGFVDVEFGTYVGSVAVPMSDGWTWRALELRIIDEQLRGIALGHMDWDRAPESTMTHGWVDCIEWRILSIKYGPTDEEEKDVDIPRDVPILKMSLGDRSLLKPGTRIFAGANKNPDGEYTTVFVFTREDGGAPPM